VRRLSVRARITIGSLLVAVLLFTLAFAIIRIQVDGLLTAVNTTLAEADLASFRQDVLSQPLEPVDPPANGSLVYVRSPSGAVQVNTMPHDIHLVVNGRPAANEQFTTKTDENVRFVVVGYRVNTSAGTWSMWAARSEEPTDLALSGLDRVLLISLLVLLAGFAVASWLLASAALRPVARLRTRAETLSVDDQDVRLPIGEARDELAELARTLNDFLDRVSQSTQREKQIVSDAAHEMRTPLAALRTQLELAHDDFGNAAELERQIVSAEWSVARLSSLADNLLELSRLDAGASGAASASTDELTSELLSAVDRARLVALPRSVEVTFSIDQPGQDAGRVAIDAGAFGRICDNLLSNAVAAVATGGAIEASLHVTGTSVRLVVTDDGPGMPADFIPRAFERFARPDDSRTSATGGSGLGLALVHAIVVAAGGTALLRNRDRGLEVEIVLPKM
jgi:two-component system OmpR family sensor kinase